MSSSPKRIFYDLVWRDARRSLIHECIFRYRIGEAIAEHEWEWYHSRNPLREGQAFYRSPEHSCRSYSAIGLELPLPEQGGIPIDEDGVIVTRIFMDDLLLCPECCAFDSNQCGNYETPWLDTKNRKMDDNALLAIIEKRKNVKEFTFKPCKNSRWCEETVKGYKRQYNAEKEKAKREEKEREQQAEELAREMRRRQKEAEAYAALKHCVYLVEANGHHKIGIASDVKKRLSGLQTSNPFPLKLIKTWETPDNEVWEEFLHKKYKRHRVKGEWFNLPDELLEELKAINDLNELKKRKLR